MSLCLQKQNKTKKNLDRFICNSLFIVLPLPAQVLEHPCGWWADSFNVQCAPPWWRFGAGPLGSSSPLSLDSRISSQLLYNLADHTVFPPPHLLLSVTQTGTNAWDNEGRASHTQPELQLQLGSLVGQGQRIMNLYAWLRWWSLVPAYFGLIFKFKSSSITSNQSTILQHTWRFTFCELGLPNLQAWA